MTAVRPLPEPRTMPAKEGFDARSSPLAMLLGGLVILGALAYFVVFW